MASAKTSELALILQKVHSHIKMSRIIITGGIASGRRLRSVPDKVRPTPARLRRAIFDILGDITKFQFIDVFAGSGAVGIEAMSRGAEPVVFIELERNQCRAIRRNIFAVGLQEVPHKIICTEAIRWLNTVELKDKMIVFGSPPYIETFLPAVLSAFERIGVNEPAVNFVAMLQFPKRSLPPDFSNPPDRIHTVGDEAVLMWQ